jgi:hypothetical protein
MNRYLLSLIVIPAVMLGACQPAGNAPAASPAPADGAARPASAPRAPGAASATSAPAPTPTPRPVVIPQGTTLHLTLESSLSSATSKSGDAVLARLTEAVSVGGKVVAPAGSEVRGRVTIATRSGKTKGRAQLAFAFDSLTVKGVTRDIATVPIDVTAEPGKKKDAAIIGGGAGAGALIGAIVGGGKGAAIGAGVGAAAGTGAVLTTRGKEVEFPAGTPVHVNLTADARL